VATESASVLIKHAFNRECPLCGHGAIFKTHFKMNRECPACHAIFWKDPGESLGAMYLDYAVASFTFLVCWVFLSFATNVPEKIQLFILCSVAAGSVLLCYPITRSAWTVLVYLSGGIERPRLRAIPGGKKAS
jgi:uncharacterized protein (DUF983 family)